MSMDERALTMLPSENYSELTSQHLQNAAAGAPPTAAATDDNNNNDDNNNHINSSGDENRAVVQTLEEFVSSQ